MPKPKPNFAILKSNHYSSNEDRSSYKKGEDVYKEIGYDLDKLIEQNHEYENTCAVRMSLALIKSGFDFGFPHSRLVIKDGPYKGRYVGTGAKTLADELRKTLGEPLTEEKAKKTIKTKKGIVFFHGIYGGRRGHIDLIESADGCHSNCYFYAQPKEVWFWPLD